MSRVATVPPRSTERYGKVLLALLPIEYLVLFGVGIESLGLIAFGWGMLALVWFETSGRLRAREAAAWLGFAAITLLFAASISTGEVADLRRAVAGAVITGALIGGLHLLNPDGLELFDVVGSVAIAFVLAWTGWIPLFASLAAAMVLAGVVAVYFAVRSRDELPKGMFESVRVSFVGLLAAVSLVAMAIGA
ncbi:MAG: hypothetical protein ACR2P0_17090 [Acidimicrobiales bacterium]